MEAFGFSGRDHSSRHDVVVVMVPFPAQGHLNQLLNLSRLLTSHGIPVYFAGTAIHNRQARLRAHGWDPLTTPNMHFHDFPTPSFQSPPPNPNDASTSFPTHLLPSFNASLDLRQPFADLLRDFSPEARRVVVIHDSLMGSVVQDVGSTPNAESYTFHSVSAFTIFWYLWEAKGRPFPVEGEILKDIPPTDGCFASEFPEFIQNQHAYMKFNSGDLYNTSKVIEETYIDYLCKEPIKGNKRQWPIGPFNPVEPVETKKPNGRHFCLNWLDKQAINSVIFVSFGTSTSLTDDQIEELANGLDQSEHRFVWVVRDADRGDVFDGMPRRVELPVGFEERVREKGIVVRDWAPQPEILRHPSTGGFMSHCGWNSCMESITMGVPIAAWPMHSDQPRNAVLIAKLLKIGIIVKDWGRRGERVVAETVEKAVKRLMGSEEGDKIRRTAADLSDAVRESVAEGGSTRLELDSFVAHITRS